MNAGDEWVNKAEVDKIKQLYWQLFRKLEQRWNANGDIFVCEAMVKLSQSKMHFEWSKDVPREEVKDET